jgi:uncharacterized protein YjbI with pentapeptide repeats
MPVSVRLTFRSPKSPDHCSPVDFSGCDLTGACFVKANLDYAAFGKDNRTDASLRRASLVEADSSDARLVGVDLRGRVGLVEDGKRGLIYFTTA